MVDARKKLFFETILVWVAVLVAFHLMSLFRRGGFPIISDLSPLMLVLLPVAVSFKKRAPVVFLDFNRRIFWGSLKWFLFWTVVVYAVAFPINHVFQKIVWGFSYHIPQDGQWVNIFFTHLVVVAFPEEFFFRGYMQENLNKIFVPQKKLFGVPFGFGVMLTCVIFTVSHSFLAYQWWQVFIFFPTLAFAWLKEKTGTVWASVFFHAISNLFSYWVFLSYR